MACFLVELRHIAWSDKRDNVIAGLTLAALAVPEVMGYTKISGMLGLKDGGHFTLDKIWFDLQQLRQVNFA